VLIVLAVFVASLIVNSVAPIVDTHGTAAAGTASLVFADAVAGDQEQGGDSPNCNHACHHLQHFEGNVHQPSTHAFASWAGSYAVAEPTDPPQRFFVPYLRPPRGALQSV